MSNHTRKDSSAPWFRAVKNRWYAWQNGKQVSLGIQGKENKDAAQKAFYRLMADGHQPKPRPSAEVQPTSQTMKELSTAFLCDASSRLKPSTVKRYRFDLEAFSKVHGNILADKFPPHVLSAWIGSLKVNSTSRAVALRSISACFGWAVRQDFFERNPARKVSKPKCLSRSSKAVISEVDHAKLLEGASADFRIVLRILHGTGCRPGEAARITTDTFCPEAGCVVLTEHKTDESGKPRVLYLPAELVDLLKGQVNRYGTGSLLRSYKGSPWTGRSITEAMRRLQWKLGKKAIAYGYRHAYATQALASGVPDATVAALLGHSSTTMLHKHYSHLTSRADILRAAAAKVRGG